MDIHQAIQQSLEGHAGLSFGEVHARVSELMDPAPSKSKLRRELKKKLEDGSVARTQVDDSPIRYDYHLPGAEAPEAAAAPEPAIRELPSPPEPDESGVETSTPTCSVCGWEVVHMFSHCLACGSRL